MRYASRFLLLFLMGIGGMIQAVAPPLGGNPNLALLPTDESSETWVSMYTGTKDPEGVQLLDRGASGELLKERSIMMQGADAVRVDLRNWVSADVLVLVETVGGKDKKQSSDLVWVRALDVVTGVRLVDEVFDAKLGSPEKSLDRLEGLIQENVLPSWKVLWGKDQKFAGVSLLDIRLVDAGLEDRQTFSSLYRMLQQMIVRDPSLILLERNRLELLREEEALSPDLQLKLKSGLVLLMGSIHQETEGPVFTLRGINPANQVLFQEAFALDGRLGPENIAERAMALLSTHFALSQTQRNFQVHLEAKRYHQLARNAYAHNRRERALEAAFAAQALLPTEPQYTRTLYKIFYEQVKEEVLKLKSPDREELDSLLGKLHQLFQYQYSIEAYPHEDDSAWNLLNTVQSHMGTVISSDPVLNAQWNEIRQIYDRSLESVVRRKNVHSRNVTESEREAHIQALVETHRPVIPHHFMLLFGVFPRTGELYWSQPVSKDLLWELRRITEQRPTISPNFLKDNKAPFDAELDDLYVRNLMLAALNDLLGNSRKTGYHSRQLALLILQNPVMFQENLFYMIKDTPVSFRNGMANVFREVREEIEKEGWFLPELYYLDAHDQKPGMLEKAVGSELRLISLAKRPRKYPSKRQELAMRLANWHDPATGALPKLLLPEDTEGAFPAYEDFGVRQRNPKRHARVWGVRLVSMSLDRKPQEGFERNILQVYEKTDAGIVKGKVIRFPKDDVQVRIDKFNDKAFYRSLLGGKDHLYYVRHHSLYQFDAEMNLVRVLNLGEWGFPDHMVANLLETPRGVFLVLAKPHLHKKYSESGRYTGGSYLNNGGVLILASPELELLQVLANIERPMPGNELEASGPFGAREMYVDEQGAVQLAAYRHSRAGGDWFVIGEDLVPRKKEYPGNSERMQAWISTFAQQGSHDLEMLRNFCKSHGGRFGLKNPYRPGMRLGGSFEFRRVVPMENGVAVFKSRGDGPKGTLAPGLYFVPKSGMVEDARMLMDLKGNELFETLVLWGEDLLLTGEDPQHRLIRKESVDAFLAKPLTEEQGPFPGKEHFAAQQAFQQNWRKQVNDHEPPEEISFDSKALDHLVKMPGGRFPLHDREGMPEGGAVVEFPEFSMSDTPVTHAEFYRVYRWAIHYGYRFSWSVDFNQALDLLPDMPDRPEVDLSSVDAMLYCNARSEWEGLRPAYYLDAEHQKVLRTAKTTSGHPKKWMNQHVAWSSGYRLPTEAEWEYVARGCDPKHTSRYPWGETLSHKVANYFATDFYGYDRSTGGLHPKVAGQEPPLTPVKTFPPQGFENRFYDLVGNAAELVWDRREWELPGTESGKNGSPFIYKGGSWASTAKDCDIRSSSQSLRKTKNHAFRVVLPIPSSEKQESK